MKMWSFDPALVVAILLGCIGVMSVGAVTAQAQQTQREPRFRVLVFSKTAGFRHTSIPDGIAAIWRLGEQNNFAVDASEDATLFDPDVLSRYKVVIFLSTTGDILTPGQQAAFEQFIKSGGGFVGIHAAADTEYDWPWFGELVGGYFKSHPEQQDAVVIVEDREHLSTRHLPERWQRWDEWYNYRQNPRGKVNVLASMDESSYKSGEQQDDHPIAWYHEFDGGRAWYTGMGHTEASFTEPEFMQHVLGGIEWAAGSTELQQPGR
jgi:type 1 glutamine amidotransferase